MKIDNLSMLRIKVTGLNLENFLFDFLCAGMSAQNLKRKKDHIVFSCSAANLETIKRIAGKYSQNIEILKQTGFVVVLKKLPYMIGGFLGVIFSVMFVWHMTSTISAVNISESNRPGNYYKISESQILEVKNFLESQNIKEGKRINFSPREIENKLLAGFDFLESCAVSIMGTTVSVFLREAAKKENDSSSQVVATNNGIIASIQTFSGRALVKAGDIVKKGQVLVEKLGDVMPKADIKLKTWQTGTAFHFAKSQKMIETGRTQVSKSVIMFSRNILPHSKCQFKNFLEERSLKKISSILPIYVETITYREITIQEDKSSFEEQREQIFKLAKDDAAKKTTGSPVECTYSVVTEGDITKVDCYLQVIEQILV
ncbi:MAG: sporulation protein YqfD [Clostridia bacterium]|nr:sporulation protein YqfD [Clostridia bacterium]